MAAPQTANSPITPIRESGADTAPVSLKRILVAVDASDHANRALAESVRLARSAEGTITGIHAYAAALHDRRFKQMEGGLPERYRQEEEMDYQREVHDDLITRGLNIISDSYHDAAVIPCRESGVPYRRLSPEGKNYARLVEAARSGDFDVIALGALGLGAVPGSLIGTVCERVVRRSPIDVLVAKSPDLAIGDGPIVAALDGSAQSYGALKTAMDLGRRLDCPVHAVAAYDPYYHYVAFNKIATVLSEEAGKVFRFKEQEQLHEELIDEGIAKIYQSHLAVGETVAGEDGMDITTRLLTGKPYQAIAKYLDEIGASLLVMGKRGIHADEELDIGGNAENLLRMASCHVWIGQTTHTPAIETIAEETIAWSREAEDMLARAPSFAQGMARKAVLRYAHEQGHTFITRSIVETVSRRMMGGDHKAAAGQGKQGFERLRWTEAATSLLEGLASPAMAEGIRLRAEKAARVAGGGRVEAEHVRLFLESEGKKCPVHRSVEAEVAEEQAPSDLPWAAAALARLTRVPEPMRAATKARIEDVARNKGADQVTMDIVEEGLEAARAAMAEAMRKGGHKG